MKPELKVLPRLLALVVLASGCSLPLPRDVHEVGEVPAQLRPGGVLQVIPPGPRPDDTPAETVLGFLGAQASSEGRHAIARQFLVGSQRARWRDDAEVQVYDPDALTVTQLAGASGDRAVVRVTARVIAGVRADGSYVVRPNVTITEDYALERTGGQWLLADVPAGLRLTAADRQRSFAPFPIYYLGPATADRGAGLVADHVFLPVGGDVATTLVTRMLMPPSSALAGSVSTAVPRGTSLQGKVGVSGAGIVTVDLIGMARVPTGTAAQQLSAQLVFTLRSLGASFRGLRLLVDGRPLVVPGEGDVQDAAKWESYEPDGLGPNPPYYFASARRLRASVVLPPGPATAGEPGQGGAVAVDAVAVTPDRIRVALLEGGPSGPVTVRIGPLRGPSFPVAVRAPGLSSPTWGSGQHGLWLIRSGAQIVRVDRGLRAVTVLGLPPGRIDALSLSRDGVRIAVAVAGRVYVGRIEVVNGVPRVVGLTLLAPALHGTVAVSWASSTELVALGVLTRSLQVLRIAVDGSAVSTMNSAGLDPTHVTASPEGVLVASSGRLYLSTGGAFRLVQSDASVAPAFPG